MWADHLQLANVLMLIGKEPTFLKS